MKRLAYFTAPRYSNLDRADVYATVEYPRGVIYYNRNKMSSAQDFAEWLSKIPLPGDVQILRFEPTQERFNEIDGDTFYDFDVQFVLEFTDTLPIFKFVGGAFLPNIFNRQYTTSFPLNEFPEFTLLTQVTSTQYKIQDQSKSEWASPVISQIPFSFFDLNGEVQPSNIIYSGGGVEFSSPPTPPVSIMSGAYFTLIYPIGGSLISANAIPVIKNNDGDKYIEITRTLKDFPEWESRLADFVESIEETSLPPPYNTRIALLENWLQALPIPQGAIDNWPTDEFILNSDWDYDIAQPGIVDNTVPEVIRRTCWQRVKTCEPPNLITDSHQQPVGVVGMGEFYDRVWGYTKHATPWANGPSRGLLWLEYDDVQYIMPDFEITRESVESWLSTIPLPGSYHVFPVLSDFAFRTILEFNPLPATTIEVLFECSNKIPVLRGYNYHYYDNYPFDNEIIGAANFNFDISKHNRWRAAAIGFIQSSTDSDGKIVFQGPLLHNPIPDISSIVNQDNAFSDAYEADISFRLFSTPYLSQGFGNNWVEHLTVDNNEWSTYERYSSWDAKYRNSLNWRNHILLGRVIPNDFWDLILPSLIPEFDSDGDQSWDTDYVQPGCWFKLDSDGWVFVCSDWGVGGANRDYTQEFRYSLSDTLPDLSEACDSPGVIVPIEPGENRLWGYAIANGIGAEQVAVLDCNLGALTVIQPDGFTGFWEIFVPDGAYGVIYKNTGCVTRFESTYFFPEQSEQQGPSGINDPVFFNCSSDLAELNDPVIFSCEE